MEERAGIGETQIGTVTLDELGLRADEPVRFRARPAGRWIEGRVIGVNTDDSVVIADPDRGSRSIRADMIQHQQRGPRGGTVWVQLEPTKGD